MPDSIFINVQAFQPYGGGRGLTLTGSGTSTSGRIPGLLGGTAEEASRRRVQIVNAGPATAWVVMGQEGIAANDQCMMLCAGWWWVGTPPNPGNADLYLAVITGGGPAAVNIVAGTGT